MRGLEHLHPEMQAKAAEFLAECKRRGLPVQITETLRTVAEQNALYAKGRTAPGNIVTPCKGTDYQSPHQWGVAFDVCRTDKDSPCYGDGVKVAKGYGDGDGVFAKFGAAGIAVGLSWGGNFKKEDKPHFEYASKFLPSNSTKTLIAKYGTPEKFKATWGAAAASAPTPPSGHPSKEGNRPTLKKGSKGEDVKALQTALNSKGFSCGAVDGDFGAKTEAAVKAFQGYNGLVKDGIVGAKTWGKLGL